MSKNLDELIETISSEYIKVVSFDIFDTLLLRPVPTPVDIFRLIAKETKYEPSRFVDVRINAEKEARERKPFNIDDIDLDDIYYELMTLLDLDIEVTNAIKQLELDIEEKHLYANKPVKSIYDIAVALGKEIIIVSDMYLPSEYLNQILNKNGFIGYSKLYVSCEYRLSKSTGRLYDYILRDFKEKGVQANEIIHFGDNYLDDVVQAKRYGLNAFLISDSLREVKRNKKSYIAAIKKVKIDKLKLRIFLEKVHLLHLTKKMVNTFKVHRSNRELISNIDFKIAHSLEEISNKKASLHNPMPAFGDMVSFDKGTCNYLNQLSNQLTKFNLVLLSESTWISRERTSAKIRFPFFIVPDIFGKNYYAARKDIKTSTTAQQLIEKKSYLEDAVSNWRSRFPDMGKGYPEMLAINAYNYYVKVFELLSPKCIILWNGFHALHHIIEGIAKEKKIPIIYMEFGSLPGTFAIEALGQMGESWPALYSEVFEQLEVLPEESERANDVLKFLKENKLNRNVQPRNVRISDIKAKLNPDRPTLLYAGQNDYESGLYPYTKHTAQYHSPIFQSSNEAAEYLAELATDNNWNLIYKPHPIAMQSGRVKIPDGVLFVNDCDLNDLIDICDLTITILSQTAYISLIRRKPTLMLGYTQLKTKGCTYEAFIKEQIENQIILALKNGFSPHMRNNFKIHIAQMLKYCLYDDCLDRKLRYGRSLEDAVRFVESVI